MKLTTQAQGRIAAGPCAGNRVAAIGFQADVTFDILNFVVLILLVAVRTWGKGILQDLSNLYCLPGKAGGLPGGVLGRLCRNIALSEAAGRESGRKAALDLAHWFPL